MTDPPEVCPACAGKVRFGRCRDCGLVDHRGCTAEAHDRSLPDRTRPYDQPLDEDGNLSDAQVVAADGLLGCNDCGRPLFYCTNDDNYWHADPRAECFLAPAWGE